MVGSAGSVDGRQMARTRPAHPRRARDRARGCPWATQRRGRPRRHGADRSPGGPLSLPAVRLRRVQRAVSKELLAGARARASARRGRAGPGRAARVRRHDRQLLELADRQVLRPARRAAIPSARRPGDGPRPPVRLGAAGRRRERDPGLRSQPRDVEAAPTSWRCWRRHATSACRSAGSSSATSSTCTPRSSTGRSPAPRPTGARQPAGSRAIKGRVPARAGRGGWLSAAIARGRPTGAGAEVGPGGCCSTLRGADALTFHTYWKAPAGRLSRARLSKVLAAPLRRLLHASLRRRFAGCRTGVDGLGDRVERLARIAAAAGHGRTASPTPSTCWGCSASPGCARRTSTRSSPRRPFAALFANANGFGDHEPSDGSASRRRRWEGSLGQLYPSLSGGPRVRRLDRARTLRAFAGTRIRGRAGGGRGRGPGGAAR